MAELRVGSTFSGIGGFDRAFEQAGHKVVWQCEIDPAARAVLHHHWPELTCRPDVKDIHGPDLPTIDVLVGGTPCQDWSVAGKRAGLAGERTGLFFEFIRLADELAPGWLLFENVPGLLSACSCPRCKPPSEAPEEDEPTWVRPAHRGRDFAVVLAELSGFHPDTPIGGWRSSGVCIGPKRSVAWRVLDAEYFGVAQRRRRVFIVGCTGDPAGAAQVLFEPESCDGDSPPLREARAGTASGSVPRPPRGGLTAGGGGGGVVTALTGGLGSGGPDAAHAQAGWLIEVPAISPAVTSKWAKQSGGPAGDECQNLVALVPEVARSLTTTDHLDGDSETFVPVAYTTKLHNTKSNQAGKFYEEYSPSLQANSPAPAVVALSENQRGELVESDVAHQLSGVGGKPGQGYAAVRQGMMVRRLTPTECCRLQGFPDDWLDGVGLADSVRYRLLGNAVCTNVVRWIAERMA